MRDSIYYSAMLHDIGEFANIANQDQTNHAVSSYKLIKDWDIFADFKEMKNLIINHHQPTSPYEEIIAAADILSCKEEKYQEARYQALEPNMLRPVLTKIKESENKFSQDYI